MNLSPLLDKIQTLPEYQALCRTLSTGQHVEHPLRLMRSIRHVIASALSRDLCRPILMIVPRADRMLTLLDEIPAWDPNLQLLSFPDPDPLFYEFSSWSTRDVLHRVSTLALLTKQLDLNEPSDEASVSSKLILAPAKAIMTRTIAPKSFLTASSMLEEGRDYSFIKLLRTLSSIGYAHYSLVTQPGQFSHRGGILDLWPPTQSTPVRAEFFGNSLESMRYFDPTSQRSILRVETIWVTPAREGLPRLYQNEWDALRPSAQKETEPDRDSYLEFFLPLMNENPTGLLDFLPENTLILIEDRGAFEDVVSELEEQALGLRKEQEFLPEDFPLPYLTLDELNEGLALRDTVDLGSVSTVEDDFITLADSFNPGPRYGGQLRPLMDFLIERILRHEMLVVVSRQAPRLAELWLERDHSRPVVEELPSDLKTSGLFFMHGALTEGWQLSLPDEGQVHLLTDAEIFGWSRPKPRIRRRRVAAAPESAYADLRSDDWVVHVDYGVGRFAGLVERTLDDLKREYLLLEYDGGDQLYVPIHQADRITRYIGSDSSPPSPSRLGTREWDRAKQAAHRAVEEIARDLLDLYAKRQTAQGHAFSEDTPWQSELEASFPYEETEDQVRALSVIKQDMQTARPMDRLICGDVGYGKTEVALRAAFKAVMDGKQVAMLVPTTVLAQQHFNTFRQRLSAFPVEVEMLSRFRTRRESTEILDRLEDGGVDVIIGTHRLLQRDVRFKDLGLLIIDEEQRFGVTHKEHLKSLRTEVDVLTLTATPIPRTLYMALTGARDISTINTPPEERLPVHTHVGPYDPRLIRQAVLRELDRGGQTFFVHNRVQTIRTIKRRLERLVPEASIAIAHGQMPEAELASIMDQFTTGEIDMLISTSIIESGLDIPNANTLIVDRADKFGLAQLYQLRGRVGRGTAQGYAYFFRHPRLRATEEAVYRLETIAEHAQLGAGYAIAMRDLEIRGAGDILGTRQHGHISAIGFHLYTRLLAQAVRKLKSAYDLQTIGVIDLPQMVDLLPVSIDLPLPSALPSDYIADRDLRLQLYRRMAELRSFEAIESLREEMVDRFGPPPKEVDNLFYQLNLRLQAVEAGVEAISIENGQILLQIPENRQDFNLGAMGKEIRRSKRGIWMPRAGSADWTDRLVYILDKLTQPNKRN
jgi:transcription-repair coupling factor (superfamily II helicase)